jgi:hypothetical protein
MKIRYKIIILTTVVITLIGSISILAELLSSNNKTKLRKCFNVPETHFGTADFYMLDCLGYIHINKWVNCEVYDNDNCSQIFVNDSLHSRVFINKVKKYMFEDNKIYLIGNLNVKNETKENGERVFTAYLPIDGEMKFVEFRNKEEIPEYFIVDSIKGNIEFFKNNDDILNEYRSVFKEMEMSNYP